LIVGDSVAHTVGAGFEGMDQVPGLAVINRGRLGCGLSDRGEIYYRGAWESVDTLPCPHWLAGWKQDAAETDPEVAVVLNDTWVLQDLRIDGKELPFGSAASDRFLLRQLDRGVHALLSATPKVVLLTTPYNNKDPSTPYGIGEENDTRRVDHFNDLLRRTAEKFADEGVTLIDLNAFVSPDHRYTNVVQGVELRADGVHFVGAGAQLVARWLLLQLATIPRS
jgi:hypothetical protein